MASELAYVLINPYTLAKSRTGGVIGRFLSRTGLDLVAARMFTPPRELVEEFGAVVQSLSKLDQAGRELLLSYLRKAYAPDPVTGKPKRTLMILLEGDDAIQKVASVAGPVVMGGGESIRDTYGDYVVDERNQVQYFEPAVIVSSTREEAGAALRLWSRYAASHGGWMHKAGDVTQQQGWEQTLVLIKPDNFFFPNARPGNIIDLLSRSGLRIIAAKVHCMSVNQAEEFYGPVRLALREKLKADVAQKAAHVLEGKLTIAIPEDIKTLLAEKLGPLVGDEQFNQLIKFMTGSYPPACTPEEKAKAGQNKCLALVYGGGNAIDKIRTLLGSTDPTQAQTGSVRREFGQDVMVNAAHASDSSENAAREIGIINMDEDLITPWVRRYYPE